MKLRELARGERCMIHIPSVCNHNPDTTVLAHVRMIGISGAGKKAPDILGAWACSACHDVVDSRHFVDGISTEQARLYLLEGVARTIYELHRRGHIKYG